MKKYVFAFGFITFAAPALAQQPSPTVNMNMTVVEAQQVLNALAEGPWKNVNPLMQKLIAEINPQIAPPPSAPATPPQTEAPKAPSKLIPPRSSPEAPLPLRPEGLPLPPQRPRPLPHPEK